MRLCTNQLGRQEHFHDELLLYCIVTILLQPKRVQRNIYIELLFVSDRLSVTALFVMIHEHLYFHYFLHQIALFTISVLVYHII